MIRYIYPEELATPFPSFATWLYHHVRRERSVNQFPISRELLWISCPPVENVLSYNAMWAYGSHFRCDEETGSAYVTYDSGVASLSGRDTNSTIDVGVLKSILMVTYGGTNVCLMKCSWIGPVEEGRRTIKKDSSGFWTLKFNSRLDERRHNPYVFPSAVSQVSNC